MSTKRCTKCKVEKNLEEFSFRGKGKRRPECTVCRKACRAANKEKTIAYGKQYRAANRDKVNLKHKQYKEANKERLKASSKQYQAANRAVYTAQTAKRRSKKLQRTPAWADLNKIKEIYELRRIMQIWTGVECHVDHIIPLQGELVSGLHVENNLQIISAKENFSKGNSFTPK